MRKMLHGDRIGRAHRAIAMRAAKATWGCTYGTMAARGWVDNERAGRELDKGRFEVSPGMKGARGDSR